MSNLAKKRKVWRSGRSKEEAFRGTAEVLCGRTLGKGASSWDRSQVWLTEEVVKAVGENKVLKRTENMKDKGRQPDAGLLHRHGQKKKAASRAMDKVRNNMEEEVYNKLEEDGVRKMTYKLAHDRDDMRGVGEAVIKNGGGRL